MLSLLISLTILAILVPERVEGFSRGAPDYKCQDMKPGHGSQSADPSPFKLTIPSPVITPGSQVQVTITSIDPNILIKGMLIQAKSTQQNKFVGTFVNLPGTKSVCPGKWGLTHTKKMNVPQITLTWNAPSNLIHNDDITFYVTIVQNIQIYWRGITSSAIKVSAFSELVNGNPGMTRTRPEMTRSSPNMSGTRPDMSRTRPEMTRLRPQNQWQPVQRRNFPPWWSDFTIRRFLG